MATPKRVHQASLARRQFGDLLDRMIPFYTMCDPLADAVVNDDSLSSGECHKLLEQALRDGIDAVPQAPDSMHQLFASVDRVPLWVDWDRVERGGQLLLRSGLLGGLILGSKSLVHGYCAPAGNKPLVFSGRLASQASRRIDETLRFVTSVITPGGMQRRGDGFGITVKVRVMHAQVRKLILRSGRWNSELWSEPINQHDMLGTILLFSSVLLNGLRIFRMRFSRQEAEDYMHLWRYVGHVIGVEPELLPASEEEAIRLQDFIQLTQGPPDDDSRALVKALLNSPYQRAENIQTMVRLHQRIGLGEQLCRIMVGDEIADQLELPRSPMRHIMLPLVRRGIDALGALQERFPRFGDFALYAGQQQWEEAVRLATKNAPTDFQQPENLAVA